MSKQPIRPIAPSKPTAKPTSKPTNDGSTREQTLYSGPTPPKKR